ncbi:unnamed protein product, partial [Hymenolepis diminuta]
ITSTKNCPLFSVVPLSPTVLSAATFVEVASDDLELHPSVGDNVKVTKKTHLMKSSRSKFVPARLVSEPSIN